MVANLFGWMRDVAALARFQASASTGGLFVAGALPAEVTKVVLGGLSFLLLMAAINSFNDYCDVEADTVNGRKDRPLAGARLRRMDALYVAFGFGSLGLVAAVLAHQVIASCVFLLLGWSYSRFSRRIPYIPHLIVAAALSVVFLAGRISSDGMRSEVQVCLEAFSISLFFLLYEFSQSARDSVGDEQVGYMTIVHLTSPNTLNWIHRGIGVASLGGFLTLGLLYDASYWYYVLVTIAWAVWVLSVHDVSLPRPSWAVLAVRTLGVAALVVH